ncbi:glycosyltransferase 61 family protein [Paenibacillus sp. HJGM_3]|uniref:glycosyltransferase 61 family protein n=1 Tax=Paenibacillus sp. HJGM_3 TaxID=3379816 RepID=UPI00385E74EE
MRISDNLKQLLSLEGAAYVAELYRQLLDREPDPGGHAHHTELLEAGMSKLELAARILQSPESIDRNHMNDEAPPTGWYRAVEDWYKHANLASARYMPIESGPYPVPAHPRGLDDRYLDNFQDYLRQRTPWPQFVCIVPGGRAVGNHGSVLTPDRRLLWDISAEYNIAPESHSVLQLRRLPPMTYRADTVAVVTTAGPYNYFHWMFDVLPRFELLRRYGIHVDAYMINRGDGVYPYQDETLHALGIPIELQINCRSETHLKAKQLVVSSMAGYSGHPPEWASRFLRQKLMVDRNIQPLPGRRRIYVSRSGAGYRRILNEAELAGTLQSFGFTTVWLERLSVAEQAQLFVSAEMIVSPHGAGLTNLIFCQPGTKIVELLSPNYINGLYWIISGHMKLEYWHLVGVAASNLSYEDYSIPIGAVEQVMRAIGCRC